MRSFVEKVKRQKEEYSRKGEITVGRCSQVASCPFPLSRGHRDNTQLEGRIVKTYYHAKASMDKASLDKASVDSECFKDYIMII